jgi:hypothetical protein
MKTYFQLESDGFNLKAYESMWNSTNSATVAGGSNFPFQHSETNPMDCQAEPFLQIGYSKFPSYICYVNVIPQNFNHIIIPSYFVTIRKTLHDSDALYMTNIFFNGNNFHSINKYNIYNSL